MLDFNTMLLYISAALKLSEGKAEALSQYVPLMKPAVTSFVNNSLKFAMESTTIYHGLLLTGIVSFATYLGTMRHTRKLHEDLKEHINRAVSKE